MRFLTRTLFSCLGAPEQEAQRLASGGGADRDRAFQRIVAARQQREGQQRLPPACSIIIID